MESIIKQLETVFADLDQKYTDKMVSWANDRYLKGPEFQKELREEFPRNSSAIYDALYNFYGGKTSFQTIFWGRNWDGVLEMIQKKCKNTIDARNYKLAEKLEKLGITEVVSSEFNYTNDGFNGVFKVNTDNGNKTIVIDTIVAGGYNVQCAHYRTLVKVK